MAGDSAFAVTPDGNVVHYSCFRARPDPRMGSPSLSSAGLSPASLPARRPDSTGSFGGGSGGGAGVGGAGVAGAGVGASGGSGAGAGVAGSPSSGPVPGGRPGGSGGATGPLGLAPLAPLDSLSLGMSSGGLGASASPMIGGFGTPSPTLGTPVGGRSGKKGRVSVVVTAAGSFDTQGADWDIARAKSRGDVGRAPASGGRR